MKWDVNLFGIERIIYIDIIKYFFNIPSKLLSRKTHQINKKCR